MSAIGEYVHYNSQNYKTWGITRPKGYSTPSHFVNSFHEYQMEKRARGQNNNSFNYGNLENELRKNSIANIMKDQQNINLDYGQKINQFRSMAMARAMGQNSGEYRGALSHKTDNQLLQEKAQFEKLQRRIDSLNARLSDGETVGYIELEEILNEYRALNGMGQRISILGNVQQGLNDYAATAWKETLDGPLGKEIDKYMQDSAKAYITSQLKGLSVDSPNFSVYVEDNTAKLNMVNITDKTGSIYALNATKKGWEFKSQHKRENIMQGTMSNIYGNDPGYSVFSLSGNISLTTVLDILENSNRFSTHWLNRHANQLDTSLDKDLQTAVIYEAITKGRSTYHTSSDFVYIDRTTGQIERMNFWHVLDMADFDINPNITSMRLTNEWAAPAEPSYKGSKARIEALLSQVHRINMQVASNTIAI